MNLPALIVDDNDTMRMFLSTILKKSGFEPTCAVNGRQALECIIASQYDLVLMDIEMPVMNGLDSTRCIRLVEEAVNRHTPVIGMTAGDYSRELCLRSGMDALLRKPFGKDELLGLAAKLSAAAFSNQRAAM